MGRNSRDSADLGETNVTRRKNNRATAEKQSEDLAHEELHLQKDTAARGWFQNQWLWTVLLAVTVIHLLFYITEYSIILNLLWNSPYQLEKYCDSDDNCFMIEQHYEWSKGRLQAQRFFMFEKPSKFALEDSMTLSTASLKTPELVTTQHLNPEIWEVDHANLPFSCDIMQIAAGFALEALSFNRSQEQQRILQIGMGGGSATGYLSLMPLNLHLDVIELEPNVYEAAKKWFAFPSSPNIKVHIMDGVVFAKEAAANGITYDSITLDASSNDQDTALISPHQVFLQDDVIEALSKLVGSHGVLSVNLFMLDDRERLEKEIIDKFSAHFESCFTLRWETDFDTKFLICSNRNDFDWNRQRERILANLAVFDEFMGTNLNSHLGKLNPAL